MRISTLRRIAGRFAFFILAVFALLPTAWAACEDISSPHWRVVNDGNFLLDEMTLERNAYVPIGTLVWVEKRNDVTLKKRDEQGRRIQICAARIITPGGTVGLFYQKFLDEIDPRRMKVAVRTKLAARIEFPTFADSRGKEVVEEIGPSRGLLNVEYVEEGNAAITCPISRKPCIVLNRFFEERRAVLIRPNDALSPKPEKATWSEKRQTAQIWLKKRIKRLPTIVRKAASLVDDTITSAAGVCNLGIGLDASLSPKLFGLGGGANFAYQIKQVGEAFNFPSVEVELTGKVVPLLEAERTLKCKVGRIAFAATADMILMPPRGLSGGFFVDRDGWGKFFKGRIEDQRFFDTSFTSRPGRETKTMFRVYNYEHHFKLTDMIVRKLEALRGDQGSTFYSFDHRDENLLVEQITHIIASYPYK